MALSQAIQIVQGKMKNSDASIDELVNKDIHLIVLCSRVRSPLPTLT